MKKSKSKKKFKKIKKYKNKSDDNHSPQQMDQKKIAIAMSSFAKSKENCFEKLNVNKVDLLSKSKSKSNSQINNQKSLLSSSNVLVADSLQSPISLPSKINCKFMQFQNYSLPPLPSDSAPERPPEPTYDAKRLSNKKISAMFQSCDITEENLKKFFEEGGKSYNVPSPSQPCFSLLNHTVEVESTVQQEYSTWKNSSAVSSKRNESKTPTYSSNNSVVSRQTAFSPRSSSYFTSTSSDDTSISSSGSDIDRPCRHYRSGRKQYKRKHHKKSIYRSSSDFND